MFVYRGDGVYILFLVYVDDILVTGNTEAAITEFITKLGKEFSLKRLGALRYFLGIHATRNSNGLHLSQSKYIESLLKKTNMSFAKPLPTPFSSCKPLTSKLVEPYHNPRFYRSIVGGLLYATITRPEIAYAVNKLSQSMQSPTEGDWSACKRVLRYLRGTTDHGLYYKPSKLFEITTFSDAD